MSTTAPLWVQWLASVLIVIGSLFALVAALGIVYLQDQFQRLHPPALASTLSSWCISAAALVYFSTLEESPALYIWLIPILLSMTVPVSTLLIARASMFRQRQAHDPKVPPPLT
jgi:multicomponent K+:H+ antiporter subunit G